MDAGMRLLVVLTVCLGVGWAAPVRGGEDAPRKEHFAFASDVEFLDGPRLEALGSGKGSLPTSDSEGNLYLVWKYSTCRIRVVRADGQVETIAGDDRWPGNLKLAEGPAAYLMNRHFTPQAGDYSKPGPIINVRGLPLKGEDQGCIYFFWPDESPCKIFKSKDKGGRWWFKRLGEPGKPTPPTTAGQSAKIAEVDLRGAAVGNKCIVWKGNVYDFDEAKGEMTCILALADYGPKLAAAFAPWAAKDAGDKRPDRGPRPLEHVVRTDDGAVYMLNFWNSPPFGVFRISPDRTQIEHIVADVSHRLKGTGVGANRDGPGLTSTWHCGPADISVSGNTLFLHSIDSSIVRRWVDGRISSLCYDGEWRETPKDRGAGHAVLSKHYQPGQPGANYIYVTYPGEENGGDNRVYRIGPFDFTKPTTGPLQEIDPKEEGGQK